MVAEIAGALVFTISAYSVSCDVRPGHPTKSGAMPVAGFTAAADPSILPIGSIVHIEGMGQRMIHDVGGKVKGRQIDVFMDNCVSAREWGRRPRKVRILHIPKPHQEKVYDRRRE